MLCFNIVQMVLLFLLHYQCPIIYIILLLSIKFSACISSTYSRRSSQQDMFNVMTIINPKIVSINYDNRICCKRLTKLTNSQSRETNVYQIKSLEFCYFISAISYNVHTNATKYISYSDT